VTKASEVGVSAGQLVVGDVLEAVRGVQWLARRRVARGSAGAHRARTRGTSAEFTEYRGYRQGDDVRRLDWKVLARTDRAYVRLTEDSAVLPTTLVVDASASMAYPEATHAKWMHAARLAVGFAAVAFATGDPVGLRIAGGRILPPRLRRGVVAELMEALRAVAPAGSPPLAPLIGDVAGRVLLISDFLSDYEGVLAAARSARARGCEVHAVHVVDAWELAPPGAAALVSDPEAPDLRRPLVPETRAAYLANFAAWRADVANAARRAAIEYTLTVSGVGGEPAAHTVRRVVLGVGAGQVSSPIVAES
jgi:uncharacterized protein (DUF58 family)